MNINRVREIVDGMNLPEEVMAKINTLLTPFEDGQEIPDEVVGKILKLIDLEIEVTELERDIYQSGADMANEFLKKMDDEAGKIADELEEKTK